MSLTNMPAANASSSSGSGLPAVDAVIVGAGIAGLWLANLLESRGYGWVLLEAGRVGGTQTLASQGLIHGGIKYALSGALTGASEAIARMPERWRRCLGGAGEIDLSRVTPTSDRYHLFASRSALGKLTGFFASHAVRGRVEHLHPDDYPPAFRHPRFQGNVYALDDFVLSVPELVGVLRDRVAHSLYRHRLTPESLTASPGDVVLDLAGRKLRARRLLLAAGAGNGPLLERMGVTSPGMQLRALHQVIVRHPGAGPLFAHCLTGIRRPEPRLTITSHPDPATPDGWLWYLGGQLATDGAAMEGEALAAHARLELEACVPWLDWRTAGISTLRVDRAEPAQAGGRRPDEAFAEALGPVIVTWPTKLSLVPDLGDRVLALLPPPAHGPAGPLDLPRPAVGRPPWCQLP